MNTIIKAQFIAGDDTTDILYYNVFSKYLESKEKSLTKSLNDSRSKLAERLLRLKKTAYQNGKRMGKNSFLASKLKELLKLQSFHKSIVEKAHLECLDLSIDIAESVIQEKIPRKQKSLSKRVEAEILKLNISNNIILYVNPSNLEQIEKDLKEYKLNIKSTNNVNPFEAEIITTSGSIIINWREHFRILKEYLKDNG